MLYKPSAPIPDAITALGQRFRVRLLGVFLFIVGVFAVIAVAPHSTVAATSLAANTSSLPSTCSNGWTTIPSPNLGAYSWSAFLGIATITSGDVWTVGSYDINAQEQKQAFTEHWDGVAWSRVPSPAMSNSYLDAVTAVSTDDVWAAGFYGDNNLSLTLIEHWNGSSWQVVPSPNFSGLPNRPRNLVAIASNDVWVFGSSIGQALVEHWNGTQWSMVSTPNPDPESSYDLYASVAFSSNNVWAFGEYHAQAGLISLAMHWDGTEWVIVPTPSPGTWITVLNGATALAPDNIWAVGYVLDREDLQTKRSLVEHWDGSSWQVIPSPNVPDMGDLFWSVWAASPNDIWAVGDIVVDLDRYDPLLEHWDGTQWSIVSLPSAEAGADLAGVSGLSGTDIWVVGLTSTYPYTPLALHWDGVPCPTSTPTSIPTSTALPTNTPTSTSTAVVSSTPVPTNTPATTGTAIASDTPTASRTSTLMPTETPQASSTSTAVGSSTSQPTLTSTPTAQLTSTPEVSPTPCTISFSDVHTTDYFHDAVLYLACHGVVSGYSDGTYRPYTATTRAQMVKIVVLGFQETISIPPDNGYTFADVQPGSTFFSYVETATALNIVAGYPCGQPGEPCDASNRPYFRPNNYVTRGQLTKINVVAAGWPLQDPPENTFADVLQGSTFYEYVETAYQHGVINGYLCGGLSEPCDPISRPYFRLQNSATRGQIAKIVYLSIEN